MAGSPGSWSTTRRAGSWPDHGAHRPLLRRQVAAELRLHESTVSRAVAGKQVLLPSGETVPFGALFGAARGVQQCLLDLVSAETVPRCDAELAEALAERGHRISRRTVAKYRATLRIPTSAAAEPRRPEPPSPDPRRRQVPGPAPPVESSVEAAFALVPRPERRFAQHAESACGGWHRTC